MNTTPVPLSPLSIKELENRRAELMFDLATWALIQGRADDRDSVPRVDAAREEIVKLTREYDTLLSALGVRKWSESLSTEGETR